MTAKSRAAILTEITTLLATNGSKNITAAQLRTVLTDMLDSMVAGGDVNDDYEAGTFTPTIVGTSTAGVGTYSIQNGSYSRIGKRVFFQAELTWSAHTGTGNMKMAGLPDIAAAKNAAVTIHGSSLTAANPLAAYVDSGGQTITIGTFASAGAFTALAIDAAATVRIAGHYETA